MRNNLQRRHYSSLPLPPLAKKLARCSLPRYAGEGICEISFNDTYSLSHEVGEGAGRATTGEARTREGTRRMKCQQRPFS